MLLDAAIDDGVVVTPAVAVVAPAHITLIMLWDTNGVVEMRSKELRVSLRLHNLFLVLRLTSQIRQTSL